MCPRGPLRSLVFHQWFTALGFLILSLIGHRKLIFQVTGLNVTEALDNCQSYWTPSSSMQNHMMSLHVSWSPSVLYTTKWTFLWSDNRHETMYHHMVWWMLFICLSRTSSLGWNARGLGHGRKYLGRRMVLRIVCCFAYVCVWYCTLIQEHLCMRACLCTSGV